MTAKRASEGQDTATGTDPEATYDQPGYEDKSFGQSVDQDMDKVDRLIEESDGDLEAAEARFQTESTGAPALARQSAEAASADAASRATSGEHRTGEAQAERNR